MGGQGGREVFISAALLTDHSTEADSTHTAWIFAAAICTTLCPVLPCRYLWALLTVTCGSYVGTLGLAGVLFYFFTPAGADECSFNVTMIIFTLIIGIIMSGLSLSSLVSTPVLPLKAALLCML